MTTYIYPMLGTDPPYSLAAIRFPLPALAALAGRAQLGGDREAALAVFLVARLFVGALPPVALPAPVRARRALGAKSWLAALALPASTRASLARAAEASAGDDRGVMAASLDKVIEVTARHLDKGAKFDLASLSRALLEGKIPLA